MIFWGSLVGTGFGNLWVFGVFLKFVFFCGFENLIHN